MIQEIIRILPKDKRSSLLKFGVKLLLLNILDLISVAYMIPVITIILNKEKFIELLKNYNFYSEFASTSYLSIFLFAFVSFYILKNIIQIKINKHLLHYLHSLKSSIAEERVKGFIHDEYLSYKEQNKGELINVVMQATGHFCSKLLYPIMLLLSELVLLILLLVFSFSIQWKFTLLLLFIFILFSIVIYSRKRTSIDTINNLFFSLHTKVSSILIDILNGVLDIKSSQTEIHFINSFKNYNKKLNKITSTLEATGFNYSKYFEICLIISVTFMGYYFYNNTMSILNISILAAIGIKVIPSLNKILNYITQIKSHQYSISILDKYTTHENISFDSDLVFKTEIKLKSVSFGFTRDSLVFDKINFSIKPNNFLGITGQTGVGKTTFLQIILGLINPTSGETMVDSKIYNKQFLSFASYVSQQSYLFNNSVLENITMGKKDIDYKYLDFLCDKLQLTDTINSLKEKYHTQVLHNDSFFSGGQKQRICIARALYSRPNLLILDEATNQQDRESEIHIFNFIRELSKKKNIAIIAVSHNKELEQFYDKTYQIKNKNLILLQ